MREDSSGSRGRLRRAVLSSWAAQVWSAEEQDWKCKIDAGVEGVLHVRWSPDSRHVLTSADFNIRVTVWSLTDKSAVPIPLP